ncbi:S28 family serine protease [Roseimarinus sediminis]|jgi:hypothetical protein|uniref:S28 family serine protease n=1 Tax=Roseimarinus sediminis TaxID=1610899 RepID=UPI003D247731
MRRSIYFSVFFLFIFIQGVAAQQQQSLLSQLERIPGIVSLEEKEHDDFFTESYLIMIEQPLDHQNQAAGTFIQRVFLSLKTQYSPVVFVTEGYHASYAEKKGYINELSRILEASQLVVEHRYFGASRPEQAGWDYLTIENAVADLHRIYQLFSSVFKQSDWIATGISKGGQNTMAYKAFYPNDMDLWVAYVGPINFSVEDERMEEFIEENGTAPCRQRIEDFQLSVLKNRAQIQTMLDSLIDVENYTYSISNEEVLDFSVLEYSFAFWQWGWSCSSIPGEDAPVSSLFKHLVAVSDPGYFSKEQTAPIKPFFIQTLKEFGYYGYATDNFEPYLTIKSADGYIEKVFLNDEPAMSFNKKSAKKISKSLKKNDENLILVYGAWDPWTAAAYIPGKRSDARIFIKPGGSHRTRISNMSYEQRAEIYKLIENALEND